VGFLLLSFYLLCLPLGLPPLLLPHKVVWAPGARLLFPDGGLGGPGGDLLLQVQRFPVLRPLSLELARLLPISSLLFLGEGRADNFLQSKKKR